MTHDVSETWHVITDDGRSLLVEYTGYAPVNVWVDDAHIKSVAARHMVKNCTAECAGAVPVAQ